MSTGKPGISKGLGYDACVAAYVKYGSTRKAAKALGVSHGIIDQALRNTGQQPSKTALYETRPTKTVVKAAPKKGVKRYIVTAAQSETKINEGFWNNLLALADYYKAEVLVAPYAYNKNARGQAAGAKPGAKRDENELFSDVAPALIPYLVRDRVQLAKGLIFCGEAQIEATAADPLSSMDAYTGRASGIFPHPKIEMRSIPSMKREATKFNYTTGTVTRANYIQRKAGQKAEFHHAYGALIVEVSKDGWWVRQLNADKHNTIYDLDVCVPEGIALQGAEAEALVCGDVHVAELCPDVKAATWGTGGLVDLLNPRQQILHDIFDMRSRPWQDELSFHRQLEKYTLGQDSVGEEIVECAEVLAELVAKVEHTIIVRSNHDLKLEKWLDTGDYRKDLVNARFFLEAQLAKVDAIIDGVKGFKVLEWALKTQASRDEFLHGKFDRLQFLAEDESYIVCKEHGGGIECGNHGHLGPNGSKGTPKGFMKMARKMIIGDKHSAGIYGGVYVTGTCTGPDVAYTRGPSSWSPTHCVVYPNGKRALVTMWNKRFFADRSGL